MQSSQIRKAGLIQGQTTLTMASVEDSTIQSILACAYTFCGKKYALIVKTNVDIKVYPLNKQKVTIGRNYDNDIVLSSQGVSRHHAVVHISQSNCWIADGDTEGRSSTNGLLINNLAQKSNHLKDGDVITFCKGTHAFFISLGVADGSKALNFNTLQKLVRFCAQSSDSLELLSAKRSDKKSPRLTLWIDESGNILSVRESLKDQDLDLYLLFKRHMGESINSIFLPGDAHKIIESIKVPHQLKRSQTYICELNLEREDSFYEVEIAADKKYGFAANFRHISEQNSLEKKLLHDVHHDALTQLPNRVLFKNRVSWAIQRQDNQTNHNQFAVLFIDLDRFKLVNDSFGHLIGDQFLIEISQRLKSCVHPNDLIARLGGDEFSILIEKISNLEDAIGVAKRIQSEISKPLSLNSHELFPSASIGITTSEIGYQTVEEILRDADTAMYQAKFSGKSQFAIFDHQMHKKAKDSLKLDSDLRRAIHNQEFKLMYQPIVDLKHQTLIGFEALIRWEHPERGLLSPSEFIPQTEENGLISEIGAWILQAACSQIHAWNRDFNIDNSFSININLSSKQMADLTLAQNIQKMLSRYKLRSQQIKLEITESIVMENSKSAIEIFKQLRKLGVQICIDDFGTGYSSLSYLHRFPIDALKIDRSFVASIDKSEETTGFSIIQSIIGLAHNLGVKVVAEGIETARHLIFLQASRCDYGQGYLFAEPLEAKQATTMLEDPSQCQWHYGKQYD